MNQNITRGKGSAYTNARPFSRGNHHGFRGRGRGKHAILIPARRLETRTPTPTHGRIRSRSPHQKRLDDFAVPAPFKGWNLYFPNERYSEEIVKAKNVEIISKYLSKKNILSKKAEIESRGSFIMDVKDLKADTDISKHWPSFSTELHDSPEVVLSICGLAMHHLLTIELEKRRQNDVGEAAVQTMPSVGFVFARIVGFETLLPLKNLRANYHGKLVSIKGTVVRASNINSLCTKMAFKCSSCCEIQVKLCPDGIYTHPEKCVSEICRGHTFLPELGSSFVETIDWQSIKIQELLVDNQKESGRIPRTVECELTNDLVDSCVPGDIVIVTGIVKSTTENEDGRKSKDKCVYIQYVYAVSVTNCKGSKSRSRQELTNQMGQEFTMRDLYAIEKIQEEKNLFRLIVASLCPAIYGHELVKAGLILALFGGSPKYVDDKNRVAVRGDPHVLVVGDPGLGKSQLLQACANVAPRSVYVCGNTTTTSGLTVTMCKGSAGADYALEAGALVLADQGCCCIDEFDKMSTQHQALLEAMEQQSISIAKAGIICSLPARTSIMAAANPIGGHYNKAKSVCENLKFGNALLSRFDLVFILLDKPDKDLDELLSKHIIAMHYEKSCDLQDSYVSMQRSQSQGYNNKNNFLLLNKLKFQPGEVIDRIPHQLLRKYIGYARTYVQCKLSTEAKTILQELYLKMRSASRNMDSTPVTTRQLESFIRLAEARAKVELRETVTEEDAQDVVEILKCCTMDTFTDIDGVLDLNSSHVSSGSSSRSKNKKFIAALDKIAIKTSNNLFTVQQMTKIAQDLNMDVRRFEDFLDLLNNQNYLLKKGPRVYKLQTVSL